MEGKFRDNHFNGVATVVEALFKIITPNKAYFGEKDFQQFQIIKSLVEKKKIKIKLVLCPIIREKDGLALSSRNKHLNSIQKKFLIFVKLKIFLILILIYLSDLFFLPLPFYILPILVILSAKKQ